MAVGNITIKHWRFRNDDGSEPAPPTGASWQAAEDTGITVVVNGANVVVRLRQTLENNTLDVTAAYGLKVSKNGGVAAIVNAASSNVRGIVSTFLVDGANTTNHLLTIPGGDTYTTTAGVVNNTSAASGSLALTTAHVTEVEWPLVLRNADLVNGDTLDFTIYAVSGTPGFTQYVGNVRITVSVPPHTFTVTPANTSTYPNVICDVFTITTSWTPTVDEVFTLSDGAGGGSLYDPSVKVLAGATTATFAYANDVPGLYTIVVTDVTSSLGSQSVTVFVGKPDGLDVRIYDHNGLRQALPENGVYECEFEVLERGGYGKGSLKILAQWDDSNVQFFGTERVDVYYRGNIVYRGYLKVSERTGDDSGEFASPSMYGLMEMFDHIICNRKYVYAKPVDLSIIASQLIADFVTAAGLLPSMTESVTTIGADILQLDTNGMTLAAAFNALCDSAPNSAVWGFSVGATTPSPEDHFYFHPRSQTVNYHASIGGNLSSWDHIDDASAIVNTLYLTGGKVNQPNLVPNSSFEDPVPASEVDGNLLVDYSFETHSGASPPEWATSGGASLKTTGDPGGARTGSYWMELDNDAEAVTWRVSGISYLLSYDFTTWARLKTSGQLRDLRMEVDGLDVSNAVVSSVSQVISGSSMGTTMQWFKMTFNFAAHSTVVKFDVRLKAASGFTAFYGIDVDDVALYVTDSIVNSGWVTALAGIAQYAQLNMQYCNPTVDYVSGGERRFHGALSAMVQASGIVTPGTDYIDIRTDSNKRIAVTASRYYTACIQARDLPAAGVFYIDLKVAEYKSDGTLIGTTAITTASGATWPTWETVYGSFIANANTATIEFIIRVNNNNACEFDGAMLIEGDIPADVATYGGFWPADTYEARIDVTDSRMTDAAATGGAVISATALTSITDHGLREGRESNVAIVDEQSKLVYAVDYFNVHSVPTQQGTVTLINPGALVQPDGTLRIINLNSPPDALFPTRMHTSFEQGGDVKQEVDVGTEKPDMMDFLRLTEKRAREQFQYAK